MKGRILSALIVVTTFCWPIASLAQSRCDAYFPLDGNLGDSSGSGIAGQMIGKGGVLATPQFVDGKSGQALKLDGTSAMRALVDLHFDACPQVTLTAWVMIDGRLPGSSQNIVSTGGGSGPGFRMSGSNLILNGTNNGLMKSGVMRENAGWMFIAGVYDYGSGSYTLHWRNRKLEGVLTEYRRPPEDALWIGALNDSLSGAAKNMVVDELRVYGRTLTDDELHALQAGRTPGSDATNSTKQVAALSCSTSDECGTGNYCAFDSTCHPESHLPLQQIEMVVLPAPLQTLTTISSGGQGTGSIAPGIPQPIPGVSDRFENNVPDMPLDDLPDSPTGLLVGADDSGEDLAQLDLPPNAGAGANRGEVDPNLTPMDESPGQQLQDDIDAARNSTPIVPEEAPAFACQNPGTAAVTATSHGSSLPPKYLEALRQARECKFPITAVALSQSAQWVVSTAQQVAYSSNIPPAMATKIDAYEQAGNGLDAVDISSSGEWVIVSGTNFEQSGLSTQALNRIRGALGSFRRIASFSFHPSGASSWLMVDSDGTVSGENIPSKMLAAMAQSVPTKRVFHHARYAPDGGWLLNASDLWTATDGAATSVLSSLESAKLSGKRVDHVVFLNNQSNFTIISNGQEPQRSGDPIWQVENGLPGGNIWKRIKANQVTGVSIAMIRNNQIVWARGYGLRNATDRESYIYTDSIFDAASISKPLAAFGILQLVQAGKIDLEEVGVLQDLEALMTKSERRNYRDAVRPEASNLIRVLQHCAAICYKNAPNCASGGSGGGAATYATNISLPVPKEMILGTGNAKSGWGLKRTGNDGIASGYTSGNYMLVQALIDIHGGGFLAHMGKLLGNLGMVNSTYKTPFSGRNGDRFARGHVLGAVQPIYAYPEMAAASLTTTPIDMAKFVIAVNKNGQSLLSADMVDKYLGRDSSVMQYCNSPGKMALGINHQNNDSIWGNSETFWHGGLHNGYSTRMIGVPGKATGLVVFMTGDQQGANNFYVELRSSVVATYQP